MLINQKDNDHVKFISYNGKSPCLCMGTLVLEIDGTKYSFGGIEEKFPSFWSSGGTCCFSSDWEKNVTDGEWIINVNKIPEQFRQYAVEIDELFNNNVEHGCCGCGGCL